MIYGFSFGFFFLALIIIKILRDITRYFVMMGQQIIINEGLNDNIIGVTKINCILYTENLCKTYRNYSDFHTHAMLCK